MSAVLCRCSVLPIDMRYEVSGIRYAILLILAVSGLLPVLRIECDNARTVRVLLFQYCKLFVPFLSKKMCLGPCRILGLASRIGTNGIFCTCPTTNWCPHPSIFGGVHLHKIIRYLFPFGRAVRSPQTGKRGATLLLLPLPIDIVQNSRSNYDICEPHKAGYCGTGASQQPSLRRHANDATQQVTKTETTRLCSTMRTRHTSWPAVFI